ncbi:MAG: hypothetical protein QOE59_1389 [Actinomycetota bacterium]|nr:hypothetical protein [Actinomycetota bacterium]
MCTVCGSSVVNRKEGIAQHSAWHQALAVTFEPPENR